MKSFRATLYIVRVHDQIVENHQSLKGERFWMHLIQDGNRSQPDFKRTVEQRAMSSRKCSHHLTHFTFSRSLAN